MSRLDHLWEHAVEHGDGYGWKSTAFDVLLYGLLYLVMVFGLTKVMDRSNTKYELKEVSFFGNKRNESIAAKNTR